MNDILKEIKNKERISDVKQEMASMEKIFELQEMYEIKNQEKNIEEDLKKMGYIDE
jgi:2-methylisocitrate lyase-like PEP mutase family enzyme